jgi:type I restriction-modification system DNA methylase subunit
MICSAGPRSGRVAVVLPQGALFRQGAEGRIREYMLKADFIEAVIGLAPNLFYGTGLAACVLILRTAKPARREGKVLFINGERLFKRGRNQNTLEPEHATTLLSAHQAFADQPGLAHIAALNDIQANGGDDGKSNRLRLLAGGVPTTGAVNLKRDIVQCAAEVVEDLSG